MQPSGYTFLFEIINFVVLMLVLQRLVFRPLKRGLEARKAVITERETLAGEKMAQAEALRAKYAERAREIDELREDTLRVAREEAARERARLLDQAREDATAERQRAQRRLEMEHERALGWIRETTIEKCTQLAGQLLVTFAGAAVERSLVDLLIQEIENRTELFTDQSNGTKKKSNAPGFEITWAKLPEDTEVARIREALAKVSGGEAPRLVLREDPALVSGPVLRAGFHVIDASIGGQLDALRDRARALLEVENHE